MITRDIKDRYINPYTDFGFKKLFGTEMNKDLLASFINSLLHGREQIKELTYLNTEHLGTGESDRRAVFDVYCENEYGEKFLVEMQRGEQQFFKDRVFTKLFDAAEIAKFDKAEYEAYEESLKALRDWKNVLETAEKKAREGRTYRKSIRNGPSIEIRRSPYRCHRPVQRFVRRGDKPIGRIASSDNQLSEPRMQVQTGLHPFFV